MSKTNQIKKKKPKKNEGKNQREKKREEKMRKKINPIDFGTMTKKTTFPVLDNTLPLDQNPPLLMVTNYNFI